MKPNLKTGKTLAPAVDMLDSRQQAYLDAMDIGVWNLREPVSFETPVAENRTQLDPVQVDSAQVNPKQKNPGQVDLAQLKLGPGTGGILLICSADHESASRLANDINRVLDSSPVWAWPCVDTGAVSLIQAVDENLFTTVAIFGESLAAQYFQGEQPAHLNSAKLVLLPSMQDIQNRAEARRALWAVLCRSGMIDQSASPAIPCAPDPL